MPKSSVITNYTKTPDSEIGTLAQSAYNCLNPNANFTWDVTIMPLFQGAIDKYVNIYQKSRTGTTQDILEKNDAREELNDIMRKIGIEINLQGDGNYTILQSSGFKMAKEKSKIGVLPKPNGFVVSTGYNSGDLLCQVDPYPNVNTYNFYVAAVPAPANISDWRTIPSTKSKKNISGFIPGQRYELRSAYQGCCDELIFSDSVFIYAQ
jgi:hypothetical protein